MRLRQIALVARDLARAAADITDILQLGPAYDDPGVGAYGLRNQVWPIGDTFLEVVSPKEPGSAAERLLHKRGGDGGYMTIFQVSDLPAVRRHVAARGVRIVSQQDRDGAAFTHLHPKDMGGAIVSLDAMDPPERWEWGGPDWPANVRTDSALEIVGAELQGDDPGAMSARWADVLGLDRQKVGPSWKILVHGGELRFVQAADGRGEGLGAFDLVVRDAAAVRERAQSRGCLRDGQVVLSGARVTLVEG